TYLQASTASSRDRPSCLRSTFEWDVIFQSEIAPRAFKFMAKTVKMDVIPGVMTVDGKYNGGERYMNVNFSGNPSIAKRT
ncbi:hypothetical protein GP486_004133, partial [Trichoglossum hirsutum]